MTTPDLTRAIAMMTTKLELIRQGLHLQRAYQVGPFEHLALTEERRDIFPNMPKLPLALAPGATRVILPPVRGPGALCFASVMLDSPNAIVSLYLDDTRIPTNLAHTLDEHLSTPVGHTLHGILAQADFANGKFVVVWGDGGSFNGVAFASSTRMEIANIGDSAINVMKFHMHIKRFGTLERLLPQYLAGAPPKMG